MTNTAKIRIYTTPTCGFCTAAKRLLEERGVPYEEVDVGADPALRARVRSEYAWPTVPVVLAEGELVGGFTELAALDRSKGLQHLK